MFVQVQQGTDLLGIPLPSSEPTFVAVVIVHIVLSLVAVVSGTAAMLTDKSLQRHAKFGRFYYWSILLAFLTVVVLSIRRWPNNNHLLLIGIVTTALVVFGRKFAKTKTNNWTRLHTICMGASFILLMTGFYVDNGHHLPFWNRFPQWFFWIFPAIIGVPILLYVLKTHRLTRREK